MRGFVKIGVTGAEGTVWGDWGGVRAGEGIEGLPEVLPSPSFPFCLYTGAPAREWQGMQQKYMWWNQQKSKCNTIYIRVKTKWNLVNGKKKQQSIIYDGEKKMKISWMVMMEAAESRTKRRRKVITQEKKGWEMNERECVGSHNHLAGTLYTVTPCNTSVDHFCVLTFKSKIRCSIIDLEKSTCPFNIKWINTKMHLKTKFSSWKAFSSLRDMRYCQQSSCSEPN